MTWFYIKTIICIISLSQFGFRSFVVVHCYSPFCLHLDFGIVTYFTTGTTTTSATFEDLDNPQPSITLSDSSNKVLVWGCLGGVYKNPDGTGSNDMSLVFQLLRDSSVIQALGDKICNIYGSGNDGNLGIGSLSWTYLDAPGDTSSHTYKVQWKRSSDDGATIGSVSRGGAYSSIILLEIET